MSLPGLVEAPGAGSAPGPEPPGPVAWDVAERVAVRLARPEPIAESYHADSLVPDFAELTDRAVDLVSAQTGLTSSRGPARVLVTDRAGWVQANISSFRRLLNPLTDKLAERIGTGRAAGMGRTVAGAEVGALLGWMSTRVLGQYDFFVDDEGVVDEEPGPAELGRGDILYYVGPNVLALEKRFGFPPREFRLWLALHEVTHRMQFTGVGWLRGYFLGLVEESLGEFDPDPKRFVETLRRAVEQVRAGDRPLDDGGLMALLATPTQRANFARIQALMSVLEGHGEYVMNRAARDVIPSAERFRHILHQRRRPKGVAGAIQRLVGMEAKLRQYAQGETFLVEIEKDSAGAIDRLWRGPEFLPTLEELAQPRLWASRTVELSS